MSDAIAVKLPLTMGKDYVGYDKISNYIDLSKQNLKMLIFTAPGERIMDINYGVGLRNFLFEPNTTAVQGAIINKINQQVNNYLPFLSIEDIKISTGNHYISLLIEFSIIPLGIYESLELMQTTDEI